MKEYTNFIGLDIGKFNFVVAVHGRKETKEYENNSIGIKLFLKDHKSILLTSLCILETTGGYETRLLLTLCSKNFSVHRANTRKVKHFIRSFGNRAKTDALDAKALALYGHERGDRLSKFVPSSKKALALYELIQRRKDLTRTLVAEKNRLQAPSVESKLIKKSCKEMIKIISKQIKTINMAINELIENDDLLKAKKEMLMTIPGIGPVIANELLGLIPELGTMSRREIASLAGLAPRANDSGRSVGYRYTGCGRHSVRPTIFLAAMAARNSHTHLRTFYLDLVARGKKKIVALVALMRKIIVIANARLKPLAS
jgi:transposase